MQLRENTTVLHAVNEGLLLNKKLWIIHRGVCTRTSEVQNTKGTAFHTTVWENLKKHLKNRVIKLQKNIKQLNNSKNKTVKQIHNESTFSAMLELFCFLSCVLFFSVLDFSFSCFLLLPLCFAYFNWAIFELRCVESFKILGLICKVINMIRSLDLRKKSYCFNLVYLYNDS